jgi:hypothetical protein
MNKLFDYLVMSSTIGFCVLFLLRLAPYVLSGHLEQTSDGIHIVSGGTITFDGYIHFASESILGALIAGLIGTCWWYCLVCPQRRDRE